MLFDLSSFSDLFNLFHLKYFSLLIASSLDKYTSKYAILKGTFDLIEEIERIPETYLKHIKHTDGLYEIRVQQGMDIFRIFCFFDQGQIVILANGFHKKTQKTPQQEIEMALKIKKEYENEKKQHYNP